MKRKKIYTTKDTMPLQYQIWQTGLLKVEDFLILVATIVFFLLIKICVNGPTVDLILTKHSKDQNLCEFKK
jgi:hypothetical protein